MAESPVKNSQGLVTCTIYKDGEKIKSSFGLISVSIRKEINRIGKATLQFEAGDVAVQNIAESEDSTFDPGNAIRIEAGYNNTEEILFEGIVTLHNVMVSSDARALLEIECRDYAFPATLTRRNRLFEKQKDSDIISQVLKEYAPLSVETDATKTKHPELVQYYCTDWDFILSRAEANGLIVITDGKKTTVKKPAVSKSPVLSVCYGVDIIEFNARLQANSQLDVINAWAWDTATQKIIKATAATPQLNKQGNSTPKELAKALKTGKQGLQTAAVADETVLQSWADSMLLRAGLARIQGDIKFQGNAKIVPGCIIAIDGFGKRFNGNAYIGTVEHEIKDGNWTTTAGMGIPPTTLTEQPNVVSPFASGLLPGISGLHIGKVTKIDEDPLGENRVQVEFPLLNGEKNTIWARLSTLWASPKFGSFFIPEKGDEVVLGFFNNDPAYPVILGSLYSSKQTPPYEIEKENKIKAIVSKSKLKIEFEEEKKIITIQTPGKNIIEINDDSKSIKLTDQHKNKIEMTSGGILIDSAGDIQLKAKKNVTIDAGMALNMKAKTDLKIEGMNVEAKAKVGLTAKGTASAEFSASGQTVVKGAMVMIN